MINSVRVILHNGSWSFHSPDERDANARLGINEVVTAKAAAARHLPCGRRSEFLEHVAGDLRGHQFDDLDVDRSARARWKR